MEIKPLAKNVLLKGGTIIDTKANKTIVSDILISDGKIAEIGSIKPDSTFDTIDCTGKIITAGFCDVHVHFREPGREDKETLESGSRAAIAGGFTRVCTMPNTEPVTDSPEHVYNIIEKSVKLPVHIHPIGALTKNLKGTEITEMGGMTEAGAVAFSDDGNPVSNGNVLRMSLEYARMFDKPVINHAEDIDLRSDGLMNEGRISAHLGLDGNPSLAEESMVHRDLKLALLTDAKLHVPHVSTAGSVKLIEEMKEKSGSVSAEVTPHHLFFNEEALTGFDTNLKVAPPIRTEEDRQALISAVLNDVIDCIATDHAPHTIEEKEGTFDIAPFGMIGLESCFGAVNRVLVVENGLPFEKLLSLLTDKPRRIMGFDDDLIKIGKVAELTILDPEEKYTFQRENIYSKSINSPFVGQDLVGKVKVTINKGHIAHI